MPRSAVWLLAATAALLPHGAISSHVVGTRDQVVLADTDAVRNTQPTRKLNGKFLHITDFHPDEFYKTHTSTEEGVACHRGKGPAGTYGAETTDCDSPFSLVNSTLDWIAKNIKDDIDFVIWTGDTARHDSDEKLPRDSSHVLGTNRQVADLMVETFSENGQLSIPIIPTFGNNDFLPHNIFFPGPNRWLQYYNDIWRRFIPEEQRHSFEFGGWFEVEVIPNKLSVFSLNTMYFFDRNAGVDGCAQPHEPGFKHMEWLSVQLQRLRERGMKAILMGHVPPARTDSKQLWDETCWQKYTLWMKQYRDVVTGSLYGHMNIDHFLLQDTKEIDLSLWGQDYTENSVENDYSIQSKGDYLVELRESWNKLPQMVARSLEDEMQDLEINGVVDDLGKKHKGHKKKKGKRNKNLKKIGGKYGERYHLSLVSPSVVPNYLPSLRVIEYNISGLEDSKAWMDSYDISHERPKDAPAPWEKDLFKDDHRELKRDLKAEKKKHKKKKGKKGKKGGKKPKYPDLVIPDGPPKGSTPGPAYSNQPFTFLGYTQYFANLTHINNDITGSIDESKWRDGDFSDKDPKNKKPKPRKFKYEVEYSTFTDKLYKLSDLTVRNYLKLAYRIAKTEHKKKKGKGKAKSEAIEEVDDDFEDDYDLEIADASSREVEDVVSVEEEESEDNDASESESGVEDEDEEDEDEDEDFNAERRSRGKKSKKRKERKQRNKMHKTNKVWIHFLEHAFVSTVPKKELKKL